MKISRKYAMMAFSLISMATIVPACADSGINEELAKSENIGTEQKKNETPWYKDPEELKAAAFIIGIAAAYFYGVHLHVSAKNARGMTKGGPIIQQ